MIISKIIYNSFEKFIRQCLREKEYFIVRVFGIDRPTQDIYVFKGYLSTVDNILGIEQ